ncbi:hypothetical protein AVEN_41764-1, partial [Araneus ventricosus]
SYSGDNVTEREESNKKITGSQTSKRSLTADHFDGRDSKKLKIPASSYNNVASTSTSPNIFDCVVMGVETLNNGNGTNILDLISFVRNRVNPADDKKFSITVSKSLKAAISGGFVTFFRGKFIPGRSRP